MNYIAKRWKYSRLRYFLNRLLTAVRWRWLRRLPTHPYRVLLDWKFAWEFAGLQWGEKARRRHIERAGRQQ